MSEAGIHSMKDFDLVGPMNSINQGQQQDDQVLFESVADHYIKDEDITVYFTVLHELNVHSNDQIGLLRAGSSNIQECLAYAPVQLDSSTTSSLNRHGKAIFSASSVPSTDEEFYQFCYIVNKQKFLGSSIPFQLNCSIDDIDLLSCAVIDSVLERKSISNNNDGLITIADHDNDDLVVIHTKRMLVEEKLRQENRQLLEMNRCLEQQKDECTAKLQLLDMKSNDYITKIKSDMLALSASHKATMEELSSRQNLEAKLRKEFDECRASCHQYQADALQFAERCRALEDLNTQLTDEENRLRLTLLESSKFSEEQALTINDYEQRLSESNEMLKVANQYQSQLEQQLRDLRLTTEKYQLSMQGQIDAYAKQASQQANQINALETVNNLLKEELNTVKSDNLFLLNLTKQDRQSIDDLQRQIDDLGSKHRVTMEQKQNEIEMLRKELQQSKDNQNDFLVLKTSFNEIEKRCVKHQKSEIEVKKQFAVYKEFVGDLERKIQDLTERLSAGADEYKTLYRKYIALEHSIKKQSPSTPKQTSTTLSNETGLNEEALVTLLRNSYELQQQDQQRIVHENNEEDKFTTIAPPQNAATTEEVRDCPMCYWEFPKHFTLEKKKEHIEQHFT